MNEIKINMIEKTEEGLVLKLPTTSVEQVKGLKESLDKKVDKVEGKQLSTNDYSTEEKNKLSKLNNYDDTNIKADIAKKADTSTVNTNLAKKVDKVSGKGLSTNDYDNTEKAEVAKIKNLATSETVAGIKSEVETLKTSKVDKVYGKQLSTNDYTNSEKKEVSKIKDKADRTDLDLKIDKTSITSDLEGIDETKVLSQKGASELNKKFDTIGSSRSATIVIANYDSTEKSKKGADYVVKKGEDASKIIMTAEQEIKSTGGKILLLEGNYDCQSAIVLGYAESILDGCGAVLVQNTNWSGTSYNGETSKYFINNPLNFKSVIIKNLVLKGAKITGSGDYGIFCTGSSQVNNCTVSDTRGSGIVCTGSSQVNNCTVSGSGDSGIVCTDSSQVSNCTVSGSGSDGILCTDSSQVSNCTVSGSGSDGIYCMDSFKGVCAFNTLKGDTLQDNSSTPAKLEYNIIQ